MDDRRRALRAVRRPDGSLLREPRLVAIVQNVDGIAVEDGGRASDQTLVRVAISKMVMDTFAQVFSVANPLPVIVFMECLIPDSVMVEQERCPYQGNLPRMAERISNSGDQPAINQGRTLPRVAVLH